MKKKIIPYKSLIVLILFVMIILIFKDALKHALIFDVNAPDLEGNGEFIKAEILKQKLSLNSLLIAFNLWQSILFPLLITVTISEYIFVKRRFIKNYIGKMDETLYAKKIFQSKLYFTKINLINFLVMFILLIIVSLLFSNFNLSARIATQFDPNDFLNTFINTEISYLLFYLLIKLLGIFSLSMLAYYLVDYFNNFIHASLSFLIIIWLLTPILHKFLPFYFIPLISIMITSYEALLFWQFFIPHIIIFTIIMILKYTNNYEVD